MFNPNHSSLNKSSQFDSWYQVSVAYSYAKTLKPHRAKAEAKRDKYRELKAAGLVGVHFDTEALAEKAFSKSGLTRSEFDICETCHF
jgi:hypothetical protein